MSQLLGDMQDQKVKFFWVEAGNYADCEHVLNLKPSQPSVIAFRAHESRYAAMPQQFSLDGMRQFVGSVQTQGLGLGVELPVGGI